MPSFPFFRFPYQNQYYPHYTNYNSPIIPNTNNSNPNINSIPSEDFEKEQKENSEQKKRSFKYNSFGPIHFANPFVETNLDEPILEILGIELYLDDLIILGLLFFLSSSLQLAFFWFFHPDLHCSKTAANYQL